MTVTSLLLPSSLFKNSFCSISVAHFEFDKNLSISDNSNSRPDNWGFNTIYFSGSFFSWAFFSYSSLYLLILACRSLFLAVKSWFFLYNWLIWSCWSQRTTDWASFYWRAPLSLAIISSFSLIMLSTWLIRVSFAKLRESN